MDPKSTNFNEKATEDDGSCNYLTVGKSHEGGVIAYLLTSADVGYDAKVPHGLIAAWTDQSAGIMWYAGTYKATFATLTAFGTGNANTSSIVNYQGNGTYAAKLCQDLVMDGKTDWYLPSQDELNILFENRDAIGGFTAPAYWSSTEISTTGAWGQAFPSGGKVNYGKNQSVAVRAVRSF